jgi:probable rRNA maturation factor
MITLEVAGGFASRITGSLLKHTAETALSHLSKFEGFSLTILITGDQEIQELNQKYREIDRPTDVLSFPSGFMDPESNATYLGDVVISYPQAVIQAEQRGHPVESELQLLVIHGTLHLLGYDHGEPKQKKQMWTLQDEILKRLDVRIDALEDV